MFTNRSLTHESGQALVQVALSMLVLLAFVALATDVGSLYAERRKMQNAADAGALAGAMVLCRDGEAAARTLALSTALANGAQLQVADITIDLANGLVSVPVSTTGQSIFARLMNPSFATTPVRAKATAKCGPISTAGGGLFPIAIENFGWITDTTYDLLQVPGPGNFSWLSWNGENNAPYLRDEIIGKENPSPPVSIGDWVQGLTGATNSHDIRTALSNLVGKTIIILVYDTVRAQGAGFDYHVVGFAAFSVEETDPPKTLIGKFVKMTSSYTSTGGSNYGVYGARLTQ